MLKRQTTGSVVCASCGSLVGVNDERCYSCGRRNPGLWGYAPLVRSLGRDLGFVRVIIGGSIALYVIGLLLSGGAIRMASPMSFLAPSWNALFVLGASGALPVFGAGRWWTVLSAGWLHAGLLHILFNMMWVRDLAPVVADVYGPGRLAIIYTVSGVCGFTLSTLAGAYLTWIPLPMLRGAQFTVGASAPIFGLLGALVLYGRRGGSSLIHGPALTYALVLFVFGLVMPGVDNYAHAGGFAGGFVTAHVLDPRRPERIDHLLAGLVCLLLTALAVLASVLHALRFFG